MLPFDAYIVSHLAAINSNVTYLNQLFLFYTLVNSKLAEKKGDGYPTLNLTEIKQYPIPLPPLSEQKAIASVLSAVQEAKERTENVIKTTKEFKKSLMKHLFTYGVRELRVERVKELGVESGELQSWRANRVGEVKLKETEIGTIPEEWEVVKLGEVSAVRKEQIIPTGEGKVKYVGLEHINSGEIKIKDHGYDNEVKSSKYLFYAGDMLYGKLRPYLDKCGIVDFEGICSTDIFVITTSDSINKIYLVNLMHTKSFIEYATKTMTGVNHPRTSWQALSKFPIPLPPLSEQKAIAEILSTVDRKIEAEEDKKKALEVLFKTLLHNLMTGKIRVERVES